MGGGFQGGGGNPGLTAARARQKALGEEVEKDVTLSQKTKSEILTELGTIDGGSLEGLKATLAKAREGTDPKFRSRQLQERQRKTVLDRPGRRQTVLSR